MTLAAALSPGALGLLAGPCRPLRIAALPLFPPPPHQLMYGEPPFARATNAAGGSLALAVLK
jgi:hypothetical protein